MITFSNLSISADRSVLNISCSGTAQEQIAAIYVEYFKNYSSTGPSEKAYKIEYAVGSRPSTVTLALTDDILEGMGTDTFIDGLFYVYVQYYELGDSVLNTVIGIVLDWEKVYVEAMSYLKMLATDCGTCKDNQELIDFILRWEALKLAIDTCDWDTLHCLWSQLFNHGSVEIADCGCGK